MSRTLRAIVGALTLTSAMLSACTGDTGEKPGSGNAGARGQNFTAPRTASDAASNTTVMTKLRRETGHLTPKSVDASGTGLVVANNMIYTHSMTLFNAGSGKRIATIPDTVDLKEYGLSNQSLRLKGGPVEGVWTKDAKYLYVSNYVMSGKGYDDEPNDACKGNEKYKPSYVYRVNVAEKRIDEVIAAGAVPKYVALTHSGSHLLVSNWCSYSMSVIDLTTKKQVAQIPIAPWPRGITVAPDDSYAYVAAYGTDRLYRVSLRTGRSEPFAKIGDAARHVSLSPDGRYLYAVASHGNTVTKINRETGQVLGVVRKLIEPRSLTVSPDGKALYVVNYLAASVTKIDATTMKRLQVVKTDMYPIGITYEPRTGQVWVANYNGSIDVFDDNTVGSATKKGAPAPSESATTPGPVTTPSGDVE